MCDWSLLLAMLRCGVLLLALQVTEDTTALSQTSSREFVLKARPLFGPRRLSGAWLAPSLISCVVSCVSSFLDDCRSVLYNPDTQLCTPGQRLEPSQPKPSAAEGFLHIAPQCDTYQGFSLQTYANTRACVFYETENLNYTDAQDRCASMEAALYTANTMDKFHLLQNIFKDGLWVGLNDMLTEGMYIWSNGQVYDGNLTAMFLPGEPNNYGGSEDCISMQHPKPAKLNDDSCNKTYNSVCEKSL